MRVIEAPPRSPYTAPLTKPRDIGMSSRPARLPTWSKILIAARALLAGARGLAPIEHNLLLALANNYDKIRSTALALFRVDPANPLFSTARRILPSGVRP